jgi:hypothetical protein
MMSMILGCFYIILTYAAIIGVDGANKWTLEYVVGFLNDLFFV